MATMRTATTLHLVAFVPGSTSIVVAEATAGWYLPFAAILPGHRPCDVAMTLAKALGLSGCLVHEAPLDSVNHQRGGRYAAFAVLGAVGLPEHCRLCSAETLTDTSALSANQPLAIRACLARTGRPRAPFDTLQAVRTARAWACRHLGIDEHNATIHHLRTNRFDLVLGVGGASETSAFLKAGPFRVPEEVRATQVLAAIAPDAFSATLAVSRANRYWLTGRLAGEPLASAPPGHSAVTHAVRQLAQIQEATSRSAVAKATFAWRPVTSRSLARFALAVIRDARHAALRDVSDRTLARAATAIGAASTALSASDMPHAWVHSDWYSGNILVSTHRAAFIDLDYSFWGPAFLPLWRLSGDLAESWHSQEWLPLIVEAYVEAWPERARNCIRAAAHMLPIVGQTFYLMMLHERARRRLCEIDCPYSREYVAERLGTGIRELVALAAADPHEREDEPQHSRQIAGPAL